MAKIENAEKELIEVLLLKSETIIAKIQFEVDNSVNSLFPEDQEEGRKHLKERNRKLKITTKKLGREEMEELTVHPNHGYYSTLTTFIKYSKRSSSWHWFKPIEKCCCPQE